MKERSNGQMLLEFLGYKLYHLYWIVQEENDGGM